MKGFPAGGWVRVPVAEWKAVVRFLKPIPIVTLVIATMLLAILALAATERPMLFCLPTFLFALAGLFLIICVVIMQPADRAEESSDQG